jgi:hypothetical protein
MSLLLTAAIVNVAIGAIPARPIAGAKAWDYARRYERSSPDRRDWENAWAFAFCVCCAWPLALIVGLGYLLPRFGPEREAIARQRDEDQRRRIAELERELLDRD